ncbi:MAG: GNAT family N-acetyltransferase [Yoonia sp.]|uniref:GNAT family N-acetyltransferase n=1 Tax=Yoonia sp. TaxID=2212373 RepID=UPI003EF1A4D2
MTDVLRVPTPDLLDAYVDALEKGWSPDNLRSEAGQEQLEKIASDPLKFLSQFDDPDGIGQSVKLPDGSRVPRLPSLRRWIWSDGLCGSISLRWQKGTEALPPTCLGHVGYAIVPWRRREGLATAALIEMLPYARTVGLRHVDVTVNPGNSASIGVIEKAGGRFVETFTTADALGGCTDALYRIELSKGGSV